MTTARPATAPLPIVGFFLVVSLVAATAGCADEPAPATPPRAWPPGGTLTWQWQLSGDPDPNVDADVFEFDGFAAPAETVRRLHDRGRRMICHLSAGAYEESRPDAGRFPAEVIGAERVPADPVLPGAGKRWIDIRRWDVLQPILADRFWMCLGKGFDAVAPADVDGYAYDSGFPLHFDDQILFNRRVAALARSMGLSPGLRNDPAQAAALEPDFDFAVTEECVRLRQCDRLASFVAAGKPVFHVEFEKPTGDFCEEVLGYGFSSIRKDRRLGVWRQPCLR